MTMVKLGIGEREQRMQLDRVLELLQRALSDFQVVELGSQHSHQYACDYWIVPELGEGSELLRAKRRIIFFICIQFFLFFYFNLDLFDWLVTGQAETYVDELL